MQVPMNVMDFLRRAALVYPQRIGVVDETMQPAASWGSLTYAEMHRRAEAMVAGLDAMGIGVGERVAMVSHNSARLLTAFFGVSGSGRILVPVNFRLALPEIQYIVEHSGARLVLVDPELLPTLGELRCERLMLIGDESDGELLRDDTAPQPWDHDENATATINYTSGTTARPKGVQLTHRNLWVNAMTFGWHMGVNDRDVYLHTLPQFHCNGWGMTYAVTGMGGRHIILRKVDGMEILRRIDEHGVTLLCAAPAVLNAVLEVAPEWTEATGRPIPGNGTVRIVVAGAPPPTRAIEHCEGELGWEFSQLYGLTETSPVLTLHRHRAEYDELSPAERAQRLGRAGPPAIGVELKASPDGEVLARGNVVMAGYWNQPEATAEAITAGDDGLEWFHTGDGGEIDGVDHVLSISDRRKDVIITGGENVSSIEVEDALFSHPAVAEVAVIGVPDERWGEMVLGLVVLRPDATVTEADLLAHARTRLAGYKCPKRIEFRDSLARTATGKLQKFKLREPYWAGRVRAVN